MYKKYVELKEKKGVTDYKVSKETGIPKSTFSEWKSGRSKPKADKLKILADYFGVEVGFFLVQERRNDQWKENQKKKSSVSR